MARTAIHPGEHLADALGGLGITAAQLARDIAVPANRVSGILRGRRAITADTALRLSRYFGTSAEFWMNLQQTYDLRRAQRLIGKTIRTLPRAKQRETPGRLRGQTSAAA
jgi:antitoxin HigA-1